MGDSMAELRFESALCFMEQSPLSLAHSNLYKGTK